MTTLDSTRQFLARRMGIDPRVVTPESTLALDGPAKIDLLLDVEKHFRIRLSHERQHITTLGELLVVVAWEIAQARTARRSAKSRKPLGA
jgi:acyl carrier protein